MYSSHIRIQKKNFTIILTLKYRSYFSKKRIRENFIRSDPDPVCLSRVDPDPVNSKCIHNIFMDVHSLIRQIVQYSVAYRGGS